MALNMRSSFQGSSLKAGPASSTPQVGKVQTQALFGRKKPEKVAKSGTIKLGGAVKQVMIQIQARFNSSCAPENSEHLHYNAEQSLNEPTPVLG